MQRPDWAPDGIDLTTPSVARVYDYWLGGAHNFKVDREFSKQLFEVMPEARQVAQAQQVVAMSRQTATPATARTRAQVERFFHGLELVEPGLVWAPQWRPDSPDEVEQPERSSNYAGVGLVA